MANLEVGKIYIVDKGLSLSKIKVIEITETSYYILNLDNNSYQRFYRNYFSKCYIVKEEVEEKDVTIEELKKNIINLLEKIQ